MKKIDLEQSYIKYVLDCKCKKYKVKISCDGYESICFKGNEYEDSFVNNDISVSYRNNKVSAELYTLYTSCKA